MTKKSLTVKEAKLVKAKAAGKSNVEAWDEAGYSQNSKANTKVVNTSKILSKPSVQEALQAELQRQGITLEKVVKPIKDGLEAEKVAIVGNGDSAMAEITPDHSIRLKSSAMAQKLMGLDKGDGSTTYNFTQIIQDKGAKYAG